jgi:hypothetical protein
MAGAPPVPALVLPDAPALPLLPALPATPPSPSRSKRGMQEPQTFSGKQRRTPVLPSKLHSCMVPGRSQVS